jgi:YidC/Oxa1 family membrane protein insertase
VNPFDVFLPLIYGLMYGLHELAVITGSGGTAIILFTVFLKLLLLPLSLMQTKSMKAMQAIQPEMAALRQKYGKDRERMAQEQMRLYREYGVNPVAGCLPMIPMMIVLVALYQALIQLSCDPDNPQFCNPEYSDPYFRESWLWIQSLGGPDIPAYVAGIPIPGILPILMFVTQLAYGRMTPMTGSPDDPQQVMMQRMTTYFMPIMLFFFSFNFPAGLVLYWTISNVFEIVRMGVTVSWDPIKPATIMAGLAGARANPGGVLGLGGPAPATRGDGGRPTKRAGTPSTDPADNPPPSRPRDGGGRKKKGKRGGKR